VGAVTTNVKTSSIHDIGETPLNGTQHGTAIYYRALGSGSATGVISGNTLTNYQKGGITVSGKVSATNYQKRWIKAHRATLVPPRAPIVGREGSSF
jgi:hypothetical protein